MPQQIMDDQNQTQASKPAPAVKPEPAVKAEPATKPEPVAKANSTPGDAGEEVFDYVYQVASFRKKEMAQDLGKKLEAAGLRISIEDGEAKGSVWHRLRVLHHGTPSSTNEMKSVLAKYGIGKPLLKKKTPAKIVCTF